MSTTLQANIDYYRLKAAGGCALVTVGDVIVDLDTGRSHPQQVGMNDPSAIPYLVQMAEAIHAGGAAASIELDHGGALCSPEFHRRQECHRPLRLRGRVGRHGGGDDRGADL